MKKHAYDAKNKKESWNHIRNQTPSSSKGAEIEEVDDFLNSAGIDYEPELDLEG